MQPIDGSAPRQLTAFTQPSIASFVWSPDGTQLAFTRQVVSSDIVLLKNVK